MIKKVSFQRDCSQKHVRDNKTTITKDGPIVEDKELGIYPNSVYALYTWI